MIRREFLVSGLLASGGIAAMAVHPQLHFAPAGMAPTLEAIPSRFFGWESLAPSQVILPPNDALSDDIYQSLFIRAYTDGDGPPVVAVVAVSVQQSYSLQLHRPEICYPASGFAIADEGMAALRLGGREVSSQLLTATRANRRDRVLYWTRIGDHFPATVWQQRTIIAANALRRRNADGALVRCSIPASEGIADDERLSNFVETFAGALPPDLQTLLLGGTQSAISGAVV